MVLSTKQGMLTGGDTKNELNSQNRVLGVLEVQVYRNHKGTNAVNNHSDPPIEHITAQFKDDIVHPL